MSLWMDHLGADILRERRGVQSVPIFFERYKAEACITESYTRRVDCRHVQVSFGDKIFTMKTSCTRFYALAMPRSDHASHLCSELALDESKSLGAVLVDILLVSVGVVSGAAVWVGSIAVRLDDGGTGGRACEA
jgi:hypothetical protein